LFSFWNCKPYESYSIDTRSPSDTEKPLKEIISREEAYQLHVMEWKSPQEIAKQYNCSDVTIIKLLKYYEIEVIPSKIRYDNSLFNRHSKEELYEMYYNSGLSANDIGKRFGVSHTAVLDLMNEYGFVRAVRKTRTEDTTSKELLDFFEDNGY
jgi:transposase